MTCSDGLATGHRDALSVQEAGWLRCSVLEHQENFVRRTLRPRIHVRQ